MATPSPKVIASMYVLKMLTTDRGFDDAAPLPDLTESSLGELAGTRVSPEKKKKVLDQITKITKKLNERLEKVVDKFVEKRDAPKKSADAKVAKADRKLKKKDKKKKKKH